MFWTGDKLTRYSLRHYVETTSVYANLFNFAQQITAERIDLLKINLKN